MTTFKPGISFCTEQNHGTFCSSGPVVRMNVSPDDSDMAFITANRLGTYENGGHSEMYSYKPATGQLHCDSCVPSGDAPSSDVFGSQNGLFMTNNGRAFFTTKDALVPQDTNQNADVYEYTEGRPQLITPGTGPGNEVFGFVGAETYPGLVSVSPDGTDVYFSTFDVLVGQDENGDNLKLYDARTDGGFRSCRLRRGVQRRTSAMDPAARRLVREWTRPVTTSAAEVTLRPLPAGQNTGTPGSATTGTSRSATPGAIRQRLRTIFIATCETSIPRSSHLRRAGAIAASALIVMLGIGAIAAGSAKASFEIKSFTVASSTTQAGGHPNINYSFSFEYNETPPHTGTPYCRFSIRRTWISACPLV